MSPPRPGEKVDVTVCAPEGFFANNPQVVRTDREIVLAFGLQDIDKLRNLRTHHHYQPVATLTWAVSSDGGHTWRVTDRAPDVGRVLDASYGEPLRDGGMVTMSFTRPFMSRYAFIQNGRVGTMPYCNHLPATEVVALTDFGPFDNFYFHAMTRSPDGALLAAGYAQAPGTDSPSHYAALFLRSEDEGRSWHYLSRVPPSQELAYSESGVLACADGRLLALLRLDWAHVSPEKRPPEAREGYGYFLYQTESADNGQSWSDPVQLPMWGHPPYLLRLQSGAILLVYGHRRPPYTVRAVLSRDEGRTWDMAAMRTIREFDPGSYDIGYPQATQLEDGTILCAYYGYSSDETEGVSDPDGQPKGLAPCGIFVSLFDEEWLGS